MANPSSSDRGAPQGATADTAEPTATTRSTGERASSRPSRWSGAGDPFELLGLAPGFDIDTAALERAFFERSKELHPDRLAGAPAAQRVAALSRSRALNDAYQLLKKPVPRAEYLLEHAGVTIGDNERLDPAFLMEILELREELAEARVAGNTELVGRLQRAMQARRSQALDALSALFAAGDFAAIKERLILLRYIHRYLEECDAALDEDD
ncbi:MAG TPA: Fe-S protein assembly co-chaperone HscB [Kofleriaceae bacterium]|nr:Fe-S protein assembly co-chaperone HscB [Kofleriaceae bacterium]